MKTVVTSFNNPNLHGKPLPQYTISLELLLISFQKVILTIHQCEIRAANTSLHPLSQNKRYHQPLNKWSKALSFTYYSYFTNSQTIAELRSFVFGMNSPLIQSEHKREKQEVKEV